MDYQLLTAFAAGILLGYFIASMVQDSMYQRKCIQAARYNTAWIDEIKKTKALQERLDMHES